MLQVHLTLLKLVVLLTVSPVLHHGIRSGCLAEAFIASLNGRDMPSWVGMGGLGCRGDWEGPGLASIVLLVPRVEVVGEIIGCQANAGHVEGCVKVSASWPILK